ncbi:MAG TPA: hypothetical protein DCX06_07520 [Opitutae bacterium]|nr:hypothetical protein [Opitutae bacterium]
MHLSKALLFLLLACHLAAEPAPSNEVEPPEYFSSYELLDAWVSDCTFGGWIEKFTIMWKGKNVELCYTTRRFTSGLPTTEITFWQPDGKGGWFKIIGTAVMDAEFKINTSWGGVTLDAYDDSTKSWIHWMTISTPMLCNGMPRASLESIKANNKGSCRLSSRKSN